MADENTVFMGQKVVPQISEIWTSQHPLMHSWLIISFVGLVVLYFAMNFTVV